MRSYLSVLAYFILTDVTPFSEPHRAGGQTPRAESHRAARNVQIEPSDVYLRVAQVRDELELIRLEMGKAVNGQPEIGVTDAAPREVFFQALTLFQKANRLCFEVVRERADEPQRPTGELRPADVHSVVEAALSRIQRVKQELGINEQVRQPQRDANKTPTDVFRSIVQANRQLNLLLDRQFAPSDVYEQVTLSVGHAARLLARFRGTERIPPALPFEPRKRPADVYRRLIDSFELTRQIAERSGIQSLKLDVNDQDIEQVTPSDVYDIASLVVSELAHLHAQLNDPRPLRRIFYPGRKFPSHVYQRAGILEAQLKQLQARVDEEPDWLSASQDMP